MANENNFKDTVNSLFKGLTHLFQQKPLWGRQSM